ncbi:MAG: hypothetical protein GYB53_18545 [Rhodobacteraceae bacterium]|nr:hypothetical protein [Paracoccaceae bacterium]MBR9819702.1 hypothetical protein [Paracoccaceae bacterium]
MSNHLTPVAVAERIIGPIEKIALICGYSDKTGYGWRHSTSRRREGDFPSMGVVRSILAHASAHDLPLRPEWLIWGADAALVEAAIAAHQGATSVPLLPSEVAAQ